MGSFEEAKTRLGEKHNPDKIKPVYRDYMRIALDAMGGDYAPSEIVLGGLLAREQLGVEILLVGHTAQIEKELKKNQALGKIEIVEAPEQITMGEEPVEAIRRKKKASISVAMDLIKEGRADAVVAAGNTGAAMAAAKIKLRALVGIERPAIGALLPTLKADKRVLILDVGANIDCRPRFLEQFALMGAVYAQYALGVDTPRVGLLNIGEEPTKGNEQALETYALLERNPAIPFVGNCEGRDVLTGAFDVVVCDGFIGNILLKFAEGVGLVALQILKEELPQGPTGKMGAFILRDNLQQVKRRMDYAEYGGGLLLGVNGICVITHGSSKASGVLNAARIAKEAVENKVLERIQKNFSPSIPPGRGG